MIDIEQKGNPYLPYDGMVEMNHYTPSDPTNFTIAVEVGIGEKGKDGVDNYIINVCTPKYLSEDIKKNGKPIFVKGLLLVESYQPSVILDRINELIRSTTAKDWDEFNRKISKYFNWEFEK